MLVGYSGRLLGNIILCFAADMTDNKGHNMSESMNWKLCSSFDSISDGYKLQQPDRIKYAVDN